MTENFIESFVLLFIGFLLGFFAPILFNYITQERSRKKYSRVFSFELLQLKHELDTAIRDYDIYADNRQDLPDDLGRNDIEGIYLPFPNDALQYQHFNSKISFLNENFEKISMFKEETIKSIVKIHSFLEEYDTLSKGPEKIFLDRNLREIQKEIQIALDLLKKE